jgi:SAM-dependent methyltransferase
MAIVRETLSACPVCAAGRFQHLLDIPDFESHTGIYGVDRCESCNVAFTNPRPTPDSLPELYADRGSADFPDPTAGLGQWLRARAIDAYLRQRLPASGAALRVLDFGCGDGALSLGLLRANDSIEVDATDFHDQTPTGLRGRARVRYTDHAGWEASTATYDAIFLRHVLEHHPAPVDMLRQLHARLRPGGRLVIEVPNRESVWTRWCGKYYAGWYVPRHLMHFDRASLAQAIRRAGLRIDQVGLRHTPLLGMSLGYRLDRRISNVGLVGLATYPTQWLVDTLAGRSSTLDAIAFRDA